MYNIRRVFSIILSAVVLMLSLTSIASADSGIEDVNKMADSLNKINILQGSNGNYYLFNNLNRAEATALIIRMLGKENYVKQNSQSLKQTKYSDVPSSVWYAPYVGFSTLNGIVAGNSNSSFTPAENVSEKAFIKMALCALGYEYGSDFNWSNVYQKAYEVGVVTDSLYLTKTQDNVDYKRLDAIKVIFRTLNINKKGTQTKMAYALVDEGVVTAGALMASGLFGDDKETKIVTTTALAPDNVEIKFSENVQIVDVKDVQIYEEDNKEKVLEVKTLACRDDILQIITAGQIPGKPYKIKISKVIDKNGNTTSDVSGTFSGYAPVQVSSDYFKIQKVEQVSVNVINVYFTHPVNINSETPTYYELFENDTLFLSGSSQNMTVKKLQSNNNAVSIYLKDRTLKTGQVYTLRINGKLTSGYGVKLAEGNGEAKDFSATIEQTGQLEVILVQAWTNSSVKVIFNREFDHTWAEKRLNYTVYDSNKNVIDVKNAIVTTTGESGGREVLLTLSGILDKTKQYELKLDYIPDVYKQSVIENKIMQFSGAYPENKSLSILKAYAEYNNILVIDFNKPLDKVTATNKSNYMIRGLSDSSLTIVPEKVFYSESYGNTSVKLYLPLGRPLSRSHNYTVYASGISDALGSNGSVLLQSDFTGQSNTAVTPKITDAVIVSKDTIKLQFNMEIAFNQVNMSIANYILEYEGNNEIIKMAPLNVTYVDSDKIVLRFDELNPQVNYKLLVNKVIDYSEIYSSTLSDNDSAVTVRWGK